MHRYNINIIIVISIANSKKTINKEKISSKLNIALSIIVRIDNKEDNNRINIKERIIIEYKARDKEIYRNTSSIYLNRYIIYFEIPYLLTILIYINIILFEDI